MGRSTNLVTNPAVKTFKWKNEKFDKKLKQVTREAGWYYWNAITTGYLMCVIRFLSFWMMCINWLYRMLIAS